MQVPFYPLQVIQQPMRDEIDHAIAGVLDRGQFILGEEVEQFEEEFAAFVGVKHCVAVGNGLDALTIALRAVGVGSGDEVLVPSHTCQATWLSVVRVGAKPVAVEVRDFLLDPACIERSITKKTKAVMPVHLYGYPCRMDDIKELANRYQIAIVEDFAQAQGAVWNGQIVGSIGTVNGTSFYPTKNLGALGDGGAMTTNSDELAEYARSYRNYGSVNKNIHTQMGVNSRLDEIQAAVLRVKLKYLTNQNATRSKLAELYFTNLAHIEGMLLPPKPTVQSTPVFHQFVIQTALRNRLRDYLYQNGVTTAVHYPTPVYLQPAYSHLGYGSSSFVMAEQISNSVLSLPIWPHMPNELVEFVCERINYFFTR